MPLPSPGDLPEPAIEAGLPTFQADALTSESGGKPTREAHEGIYIKMVNIDDY